MSKQATDNPPAVREDGAWRWWCVPELDALSAADCLVPPVASTPVGAGRGSAWWVSAGGIDAVLRHYRRGGFPALFSDATFVYFGVRQSRPWREWVLTHRLWCQGLPVARPLAAGLMQRGFSYKAALLTERLPDAIGLGDALSAGQPVDWVALAQTVAAFHAAGLDHVDLNADNLISSRSRWHVIDFDRCRLRAANTRWQRSNCTRLQRSLHRKGVFSQADWRSFEAAYKASMAAR